MKRGGYVYIMTNTANNVLYTGVTSELRTRVYKHKEKHYPKSFTKRYNLYKLVYYEFHLTIDEALNREKQIKGGRRAKKLELINSINPEFKDLFDLLGED